MAWKRAPLSCFIFGLSALELPAGATTIDFESPVVTAPEGFEFVSSLVLEGVTFGGTPSMWLFREDAVSGCQEAANQRLAAMYIYPPSVQPITVRASFPGVPAPAVHAVRVDVGATYTGDVTLELLLYDSDDALLAESHMEPPDVDCWLRKRATLAAESPTPVAYAVISAYDYPPPDDCLATALGPPWCAYEFVWIDDLEFGGSPSAVESATWGRVKALYQ